MSCWPGNLQEAAPKATEVIAITVGHLQELPGMKAPRPWDATHRQIRLELSQEPLSTMTIKIWKSIQGAEGQKGIRRLPQKMTLSTMVTVPRDVPTGAGVLRLF